VWANGKVKVPETVTWSRVRFTGYSFIAVDVAPANAGGTAKLTVRALKQDGTELDRVVIARTVTASPHTRAALSDLAA
jgi:hypothetical protein